MLFADSYRSLRQFGKEMAEVWPRFTQIILVVAFFGSSYIFFGWKASAVITLSVYVHELGHWFAFKHLGVQTKGIFLKPFFWGAETRSETTLDVFGFPRAFSCLSGPVAGLLCTSVYMVVYLNTGNEFWHKAAVYNAVFNLFNLIPASTSSDGWRVFAAVVAAFSDRWVKSICIFISTVVVIFMGVAFSIKIIHMSWYFQLFFLWVPIKTAFGCFAVYSVVCKLPEIADNFRQEVEQYEHLIAFAAKHKQRMERFDPELAIYYDKQIKETEEKLAASRNKLEAVTELTIVRMPRTQACISGSLYLATTVILGVFACS